MIGAFFAAILSVASFASETVQYVDYGSGYHDRSHRVMNTLDVVMPSLRPGEAPAGGVLFFHGGGFTGGTKEEVGAFAEWLASLGYVVFNANYRTADAAKPAMGYPYPAAYVDAEAAMRWVRANAARYRITREIAAMGVSAGATIAASLGVTPRAPVRATVVVSIAGRMDFTRPPIGADPRPFFLPNGNYLEASPVAHVTATTSPFLFFHGAEDRQVEIEHSRLMSAALRAHGVEEWRIEGSATHDSVLEWVLRTQGGKIREFLGPRIGH